MGFSKLKMHSTRMDGYVLDRNVGLLLETILKTSALARNLPSAMIKDVSNAVELATLTVLKRGTHMSFMEVAFTVIGDHHVAIIIGFGCSCL